MHFGMRITVLFLSIFFVQSSLSLAQNTQNSLTNSNSVRNVVYIELLGNGAYLYSLNYERNVYRSVWGRIGGSYGTIIFSPVVTFPTGISYLIGREGNYFEIGLGATFVYIKDNSFDLFNDEDTEESHFGVSPTGTLGYRYQPMQNDLFFKIAFTPFISTLTHKFVPFGGISFGYSF